MGGKNLNKKSRCAPWPVWGFHSQRTDLRKDMACVCTCVGGFRAVGRRVSVRECVYVYMCVHVRRKESDSFSLCTLFRE